MATAPSRTATPREPVERKRDSADAGRRAREERDRTLDRIRRHRALLEKWPVLGLAAPYGAYRRPPAN